MSDRIDSAGFAWFRRENYARIREISSDRRNLPRDFSRWERRAEYHFVKFAAGGIAVAQIYVDPAELLTWCNERGRRVDRYSRAEFAGILLSKAEELAWQAKLVLEDRHLNVRSEGNVSSTGAIAVDS